MNAVKIYMHSLDMHEAISTARKMIRDRMRYYEIDEDEETFLESLHGELWVSGIEW